MRIHKSIEIDLTDKQNEHRQTLVFESTGDGKLYIAVRWDSSGNILHDVTVDFHRFHAELTKLLPTEGM